MWLDQCCHIPPTAPVGFVGLEGNPLLTPLAGSVPQISVATLKPVAQSRFPQITCCPNPDVGALPIAGILGCAHTSCLFSLLLCFGADVFIPRLWPELAQGPAAVWADLTLCAPESGAGASQKGQGGRRGRAGSGLLCPGTSPMIEVFFRPLQKCQPGSGGPLV